jgi:hypothetical protein
MPLRAPVAIAEHLALLAVTALAAGCAPAPAAPAPSVPAPTVLPAAPQAVLAIRSDASPALGITGFTPLLFDASGSTGAGLIYFVEYGDGATSSEAVTSHVSGVPSETRRGRKQTARLTVSDRFGRSDTVTLDYFIASVWSVDFWYCHTGDNRSIWIRQDGSSLSGTYRGPENRYPALVLRLTGSLSDQRTVHLRSEDGSIEFHGSVEWRQDLPFSFDQSKAMLRLTMRGGKADGETLEFRWADLY